jgi:hypothetical protein
MYIWVISNNSRTKVKIDRMGIDGSSITVKQLKLIKGLTAKFIIHSGGNRTEIISDDTIIQNGRTVACM